MVLNPFSQVNGMYHTLRYRSLNAITQLPGVELDIACQTSM